MIPFRHVKSPANLLLAPAWICWVLAGPMVWADPAMSLGHSSGLAGSAVAVPLTLANNVAGVAVQFEVQYPASVLSFAAALGGPSITNHTVVSRATTNGTLRVLIYSLKNSLLPNDVLANLSFAILANAPNTNAPLLLSNVIMADVQGSAIGSVGTLSGAVTISATGRIHLGNLLRLLDGTAIFDLTGVTGSSVVIEASSNLTQWLPISTNANVNGSVNAVDPGARGYPYRFYRASQTP